MKPALSVVFFTVVSGAGLGLLSWTELAMLAGMASDPRMTARVLVLALLLVTAGLLSSTLHLANARNAWQSYRRFASSWLAREAVFALLLFPVVLLCAWQVHEQGAAALVLAVVSLVVSLAVLVSTVMIYACLRTIPHWSNWQTRIGMPLFGLMSGALLLLAVHSSRFAGTPAQIAVLVLLGLGLGVKYSYYISHRRIAETAPSVNEALNLGIDPQTQRINARVRLLDVGHAHGTFLTREFGYELPRTRVLWLRLSVLGLGFVVPACIVWWWPGWIWVAVACCVAGLLLERWLFFAEARHVVRLYHGMDMGRSSA